MNTTCVKCHNENAYFNGVSYECPDCDFEWGSVNEAIPKKNYKDDDIGDEEYLMDQYDRLSSLEKPFFKLKHGKKYNCQVKYKFRGNVEIEEITIVPLAFNKQRNELFILVNPLEIHKKDSNAIQNFAKMDFETIWNDGARGYFDDYRVMPLTDICATSEDDMLVSNNILYYGFEEVAE